MKKILLILLILAVQNTFAQQQYTHTNFLLNDYFYNPAIAGSKNVHMSNVGFRKQWSGFEGAPLTLNANFYGSYKNKMKHGYGASIMSDKTGLMQKTGIYLNYAYHIDLNENLRLGLGVQPGYLMYNVKLYNAQVADIGDDVLTGNVLATNALDLSSGINLYSDKFFVRLSMYQMLGDGIKFTGYNDALSKHYTAIGGYTFKSKQKKIDSTQTQRIIEKFEFQPSIMLNYVNPIPTQVSFMFKTTYNDKIWLGITYRTQDALGLALGVKVSDRFTIGYGFDYSMGSIKGYNTGSHELTLSFVTTSKKITLDDKDEELNNSIFENNKRKFNKKNKE